MEIIFWIWAVTCIPCAILAYGITRAHFNGIGVALENSHGFSIVIAIMIFLIPPLVLQVYALSDFARSGLKFREKHTDENDRENK